MRTRAVQGEDAAEAPKEAPPYLRRTDLTISPSTDPAESAADRRAAAAGPHPVAADASTGDGLAPHVRAYFERSLGADLGGVRLHTDAAAADAAASVGARAFTLGKDVVFGRDAFAPGTPEGHRLLAHELAHASAGGDASTIHRDLAHDASGTPTGYEFRFGVELDESFVRLGKKLSRVGPIHQRGSRALRAHALRRHGTVDDAERMFIAGLRDAGNAEALQRIRITAGGSVTFSLATIRAELQSVIDLERDTPSTRVTTPLGEALEAFGDWDIARTIDMMQRAEDAAEKEIAKHGRALRAKTEQLLIFASTEGVSYVDVLHAMLAAASDSSADDKVMAGVVFAIAARADSPMADDLRSGLLKVDALRPVAFAAMPGHGTFKASYVVVAQATGAKGDTIYVDTDLDPNSLYDRGVVVHELRHAEDDRAASGLQTPTMVDLEAAAYRAQARYYLEQMIADPSEIGLLASLADPLEGLAMILETRADRTRYEPVLVALGAASSPALSAADVGAVLSRPVADLEALFVSEIERLRGFTPGQLGTLEGRSGESIVDLVRLIHGP